MYKIIKNILPKAVKTPLLKEYQKYIFKKNLSALASSDEILLDEKLLDKFVFSWGN